MQPVISLYSRLLILEQRPSEESPSFQTPTKIFRLQCTVSPNFSSLRASPHYSYWHPFPPPPPNYIALFSFFFFFLWPLFLTSRLHALPQRAQDKNKNWGRDEVCQDLAKSLTSQNATQGEWVGGRYRNTYKPCNGLKDAIRNLHTRFTGNKEEASRALQHYQGREAEIKAGRWRQHATRRGLCRSACKQLWSSTLHKSWTSLAFRAKAIPAIFNHLCHRS